MELTEPAAPVAIRLAGWRTAGTGRAPDRHHAARADLGRMPMTARTAGARTTSSTGPGTPSRCRTAGCAP